MRGRAVFLLEKRIRPELPMSDMSLARLKDSIESFPIAQQQEVLGILAKHAPTFLSENSNGTFVNMSELPSGVIGLLRQYADYIDQQQAELERTESERRRLENAFFNGDKDTPLPDKDDVGERDKPQSRTLFDK